MRNYCNFFVPDVATKLLSKNYVSNCNKIVSDSSCLANRFFQESEKFRYCLVFISILFKFLSRESHGLSRKMPHFIQSDNYDLEKSCRQISLKLQCNSNEISAIFLQVATSLCKMLLRCTVQLGAT